MSQNFQDWTPVGWDKSGTRQKGMSKEAEINRARRAGEEVETEKKWLGGQNSSSKICLNVNNRKIEEDTGDYHVDRVSTDFCRSLQQARQAKKLTQAQLAQAINEKTQVIAEYESGKAIPQGGVISKLNRILGVSLPRATPKTTRPVEP